MEKMDNFDPRKFCAIAINLGNRCREKLKRYPVYIHIHI